MSGPTSLAHRTTWLRPDLWAVHRVGPIAIGESALTVLAAAAHRGRAFEACEAVADRVKAQVPIWKEQELTDGSTEWVGIDT